MNQIFLVSILINLLLQFKAQETCDETLLDNAKIYSSSSMSNDRGPDKARLNGIGAWTAKSSDFSQYLIIDLRDKRKITAIATQGRPFTSEFVQEYRIEYGNKMMDYSEYKDQEGHTRLFTGNVDGDGIKVNKFGSPIIAQWIRINPTRWRDRISMRVELYGCDYVSDSVHFDGKSYISKDLQYAIASESERIKFRFRTNRADGIILYSRGTQGDFLSLQLIHNKLLLNIDLGGEGIVTSISVGSLLDDNMWHDVYISRKHKDITFSVDRVVVPAKIRGDFFKLNLKREIYVGGVPNFNQNGIVVTQNYTGCIENLFVNETNFIQELKEHRSQYKQVGDIIYTCQYEQVTPVSFFTSEAHLRLSGHKQAIMNCSFEFRTFNEDGLLLYNKFSQGFVKLYLEKGKIKIELQGENTPKVSTQASDRYLSDGLWHKSLLILEKNRIELHVDGKPSITTRQFSMLSGDEYLVGGGVYGAQGFIGCMRYIHIAGHYIRVTALAKNQYSPEGVVFDACQMTDRCNPNPCEHGGVCKQNWEEFKCDCEKTGYSGAVCHTPVNFVSCEAYKLSYPKSRRVDINVDIDGSGPLKYFPVTCEYPFEGPAVTVLHHKNERPTEVKGFNKPGSFIQNIIYHAEMDQIIQLVNRSYSCKQNLRYECFKARLFNSPSPLHNPFEPFSWWVSRNNRQMDYWGGSLPGSRKCNCGLYGTCKDPSKWCNCDSDNYDSATWLIDEGDLTQKEFLPVRQLRFGDTGTTMDDKKGRYYLGPLICEGDSVFDNVVTFYYEDATIDLPTYDMGHSGDIYFQFKTTTENGILLSSRGPTDYIKVMLVEGDQIQFQYYAGNGPLGVSVETSYKLNDNNWHSVLVERNRKEARVVVDGSLSGEVRERSGPVRALYLTSKLIIGASVDYREGYVGCIRAFMLNGEVVDLQGMAAEYPYGIDKGCVGKCLSNSACLNNGTCIEGYSRYDCDCQWTGFKGPICADEIGVNLNSDSYIRYNFETTISTMEEYIRVGFTTTDKSGMIIGLSSYSDEYLNLMMSTSGHLRLVFDFGFERQEIIIKNENFALGQHHDLKILRSNRGSKITIYVDNYEPIIHTFKIDDKADAQFNRLKSIYVGRNETMGTGEGFVGCISRVQFDDHFPLRRLFQESRRANVWAHPENIREDDCGIEPFTHPSVERETRPPPTLPPGVHISAHTAGADDSAILGGILALIFLALILMAVLIGRYMSRHKGEYKTHEDTGAKDAPDADTAIRQGKTGHGVPKREEWFI